MQSVFHFGPPLLSLLCKINLDRLGVDAGMSPDWLRGAEQALEAVFTCSRRLAVYGTLAPGELHGRKLANLNGSWQDGLVRGDLYRDGWGTERGCPGLKWEPDGLKVPIKLLTARDLPEEWERLDSFEGEDYVRILVPIENDNGVIAIANLYAIRHHMLDDREKLLMAGR
ncbi:gamma-glutamyl AIG2-like cyclotransferase [Aestuariispira insulae]|uniref:Gamma-glutamyl AIG2-like cyclotransferase n=2 Tax=Aestuariispira insulae TaxID=1461337 RepID=A0A3D9HRX1_9PROT|nr:gamma-glutamyl AIG2-like cyclotransferase [Aestuariispira insulae]